MAKFNKNGVEITPRDLKQFDIYLAQPGAGRGLLKGAGILSITIALCAGAWYGTKKFLGKSGSSSNEKKNPSPVASKAGESPVDTPYEEVPKTPIENPLAKDISRLLCGGEDISDLTTITPEMLAVAPDTNVMQGVIHQGINLILAEEKCGKTILAMQIAIGLAKGESVSLFPDDEGVVRQRVIYYDTETGRSTVNRYYREALEGVLNKGLYLREGATGWHELLEDIAEQVVVNQQRCKDITFVLDCIYDYTADETNKLQKGIKKLRSNARELYGCNITVIMITHLKEDGTNVGSKNLTRAAAMWIRMEKIVQTKVDDKNKKSVKENKDSELLESVSISWAGRYPSVGNIICIAKGEKEGFPGNIHFEVKPLSWMEAKKDENLKDTIIAVAGLACESYMKRHGANKIDSKCLAHAVDYILKTYNVEVNPETVRSWMKNAECSDI